MQLKRERQGAGISGRPCTRWTEAWEESECIRKEKAGGGDGRGPGGPPHGKQGALRVASSCLGDKRVVRWAPPVADTGPPALKLVEIEIDHRGRVQSQHLAQQQSADDGNSQGTPQLRSGAGA